MFHLELLCGRSLLLLLLEQELNLAHKCALVLGQFLVQLGKLECCLHTGQRVQSASCFFHIEMKQYIAKTSSACLFVAHVLPRRVH